MAEPRQRRTFTKEFKPDVVAQSYQRANIAELARLRRELADAQMERDILKKALGIPTATPADGQLVPIGWLGLLSDG